MNGSYYSSESGSLSADNSPGSGGEGEFGGGMSSFMMSMMTNVGGAPSPGMGTTAKSSGALCKVQSQSSPLAAKSPVMSPSAPSSSSNKRSPPGGGGSEELHRQKTTDLFLSQFQAQMSQMKSAMDELLMKSGAGSPVQGAGGMGVVAGHSSHSSPSPATPPPASKAGAGGRKRAAGGNPGGGGGGVTYQSQITTTNGLKLKIRKSPKAAGGRKRGPKGTGGGRRSRGKRRSRKKEEDDEDDFEDDLSDNDLRPSKSWRRSAEVSLEEDDPVEPSGWGDKLPEEVLELIFSHAVSSTGSIPFLVRASRVSRLWKKVASKSELWTDVDLASSRVKHVYRTERNLIYFLEHRFSHAKSLNLGGWSSALTPAAVEVLGRCLKELESLAVSSCQKLGGPQLKLITEQCPCLKKLDLSAISTTYNTKSAVAPAVLQEAAEAIGSRLTSLSLANNCLANCPQVLSALANNCPNLEVLDLSSVTNPRRDPIPINVEHLQQGCPSVRILRLTNSDFALEHTSLKEQVASPGFPKLEELSIAVDPKKCVGMDDGDLERMVKGAKKLRLLDVRGCGKISDSGLVRVPAWDLEHLYLSGCYATKSSNDGLELIVRKWRHSFKEIDFSWTPNEDAINLAVSALAEVESPAEEHIPPVKVLDLCGSSVSLDSIKKALRVCVFLTRLNLTSCRALPRGMKRNYGHVEDVVLLREQVLSGKFDDNTAND